MVYCIGLRDAYEAYFRRWEEEGRIAGERPEKLGRTPTYPGGSVWATPEQAAAFAGDGYTVYGVAADWGADTEVSADGQWHDLLRDAPLYRLSEVF